MFGFYRFVLALLVVSAHLWSPVNNWTGVYAVFGFYMLSGYLMTLVLNDRYGFSVYGLKRFFINRGLRIFPPYIFVLLLTILLILILGPDFTGSVSSAIIYPSKLIGWIQNIFIFGLNDNFIGISRAHERFIPVAWSLDLELTFYILMGLLLSRNKRIVLIWFIAGFILTIYMIMIGKSFSFRYFTIWGASLPFSIGALMYYYCTNKTHTKLIYLILFTFIFFLHTFYANYLWENPRDGLYFSLIISFVLQYLLMNINATNVNVMVMKLDKFLGDLAYPIFLSHFFIAIIISVINPVSINHLSPINYVSALIGSIFLAALIHNIVEVPLAKIRNRIRNV